jgi:phosphoribosylanthranilate isomerase
LSNFFLILSLSIHHLSSTNWSTAPESFFKNTSSFIDEVLCEVPLDTLQFHGDETPIECSQYAMPFIKALRVHQDTNLIKMADYRLG